MDDFYVYLPSNVNSIYFENTSANYKTKLVNYLNLRGEFEVGLAEISYTFSFYNIYQDEKFLMLYMTEKNTLIEKELLLKKGKYTIEELISTLNEQIKFDGHYYSLPKFELFIEKRNRKIKLTLGKTNESLIILEMGKNLSRILGFDKRKFDNFSRKSLTFFHLSRWYYTQLFNFQEERTHLADFNYDITSGVHTMFIYCDIIKPHLVGDSLTNLLKFIEMPNNINYGEQVHLIYDNIQYFPLQTNEFESIEIDIKDDTGLSIPFNYAKNIVVLHFRKKNNKRRTVIETDLKNV